MYDSLIVITPIIGAATFSAEDIVGGKLIIPNYMRNSEGFGVLNSLILVDTSKQNAPLILYIFSADLAGTYTDNAAEAITAADWRKCIGSIAILDADYKDKANASLVMLGSSRLGLLLRASIGSNLYGLLVTSGTPTYGANALQLILGIDVRA